MKIGILGFGHIGKTLLRELSKAGHEVKVANSRGPETIELNLLTSGAQAVTAQQAVRDVDAIILSVPLNRIPDAAILLAEVPAAVTVIDTSNYYPHRDEGLEAIAGGQVESVWVVEQLGRPVAKAWNAIGSDSFARKGQSAGTPGRIAIPVSADRDEDRDLAMALVNDSGFDAVYAGKIAESWRQQPGAPVYCTDLTHDEIAPAVTAAEKSRLPTRRDLCVAVIQERIGDTTTNPDANFVVRLNRAIFM